MTDKLKIELIKAAGKDYKCQLIVYASNDDEAKALIERFAEVQPVKVTYRTLKQSKN